MGSVCLCLGGGASKDRSHLEQLHPRAVGSELWGVLQGRWPRAHRCRPILRPGGVRWGRGAAHPIPGADLCHQIGFLAPGDRLTPVPIYNSAAAAGCSG